MAEEWMAALSEKMKAAADQFDAMGAAAKENQKFWITISAKHGGPSLKGTALQYIAVDEVAALTKEVPLAAPGDWDPTDHPKDAEGKFTEKGHGTFSHGKFKKAKFALQGKIVEHDLAPGDKAFKLSTVKKTLDGTLVSSGAVLIQHQDGSVDSLSTDGVLTPAGSNAKAQIEKGFLKQLDENPLQPSVASQKVHFLSETVSWPQGKPPTFTHPVSGAQTELHGGAKVYQHKASPNSFLIFNEYHPSASIFYTKNGKPQKAPQKALDVKDSNYSLLYENLASKPVSAPSIDYTKPPEVPAQQTSPEPELTFTKPSAALIYASDSQGKLQSYLSLEKAWYNAQWKLSTGPLSKDFLGTLKSPEFKELTSTPAKLLFAPQDAKWSASEKLQIGKVRSRFVLLTKLTELAEALDDPQSFKVLALWDSVEKRLAKPGVTFGADFPFPGAQAHEALTAAVKKWQFEKSKPQLGFDPKTAPAQTIYDYAVKQGFAAAPGLSEAQVKQWLAGHLGDPLVSPSIKAQLETLGQTKMATAQAQLYLKTKLKADPKLAEEILVNQGKVKQSFAAQMHTSYTWQDQSIDYLAPDTWLYQSNYKKSTLTTGEVLALIGNSMWTPVSNKLVDGGTDPKHALAVFIATHGSPENLTTAQANFYIKQNGGNYVGKMNALEKARWIRAHLSGDKIFEYWCELQAASKSGFQHKDATLHAGSPESPTGKAAHQALSNYVHSFEWGADLTAGKPLSSEQYAEAKKVLPWLDLYSLHSAAPVVKNWAIHHSGLKKFPPNLVLQLPKEADENALPPGISEEAWALVISAEDLTGNSKLAALINDHAEATFAGLYTTKTATLIPKGVKKLAQFAVTQNRADIMGAVVARINSGHYIPKSQPTWSAPLKNGGTSKPVPLSPGASVHQDTKYKHTYHVIDAQGNYEYNSNTGVFQHATHNQAVAVKESPSNKKLFSIPDQLTFAQAQKDIGTSAFVWDAVVGAEKGNFNDNIPLFGQYTKKQIANFLPEQVNASPHVKANLDKLPLQVAQLYAWSISQNDQTTAGLITYKLKQGHYSAVKALEFLSPGKSYSKHIMSGETSEFAMSTTWSDTQVLDLLKDLGLPNNAYVGEASQKLKSYFLDSTDAGSEPTLKEPETGIPEVLNLKKTQKKLGGMHSKQAWVDQNGNEWMSKAFPTDPNSKARINAEHVANALGRLHGFGNPQTRVMQLGGSYAYVQHLVPAQGDFAGKTWKSVDSELLAQAMEEHVLDWLTSNHDTHPNNLLVAENGKDVIGIDKGQAWKFFGQDKLAAGYLPPGNPQAVWYDGFYNALTSGTVPQATADAVTKRVLTKAWQAQSKHEDETKALLGEAFKDHTSFPGHVTNPSAMVIAVMARKQDLLKDFEKFYKDLYSQSKLKWAIDVEKLKKAKLDEHTHTSVSAELAQDVKQSGSHGKALMFNTLDLHDAHLLLYVEQVGNGQALMMQGSVRKAADKLVTKWLKAQTIEGDTGTVIDSGAAYEPDIEAHKVLPFNDQWFAKIIAGVKTVNHHQGDGEYNQATLNALASVHQDIQGWLMQLKTWEGKNPNKPFDNGAVKMVTKEQQEAWKTALEKYTADIAKIQGAKNAGQKVAPPHIVIATYTPSPSLDPSSFLPGGAKGNGPGSPETVASAPTWTTSSGTVYSYDADNDVWETEDTDGETIEFSNDEMAAIAEDQEGSITFNPGKGAKDVASQATVTTATKVLKVTKRAAYGSQGTYDHDKGILAYKGKLKAGFTGYQYDVEHGSVRIEYRPHNEPGVSTSQQGMLKVRVDNWTGDEKDIEDVLDTLKTMGLNLSDADEEGLQLFYWRHMVGILKSRKDRNEAKWKKVLDAILSAQQANPKMTPSQELDMLKGAWALTLTKPVVDKAPWEPKFSRFRPHAAKEGFTSGRPYWVRPDFTLAQLKAVYGDSLPASRVGNSNQLPDLVSSGGSLTTEERLRVLGQFLTGMSSSADQNKGSAGFVFMRQNMATSFGNIIYHPRVALRTTNYAFNGDFFGNKESRATNAFFDLAKASKHGGSSNEMMVKYGVSLLDDIAVIRFASAAQRDLAIKRLKDQGITHIHGIPIESLFVLTAQEAEKARALVWKAALAEEGNG